MPIIELGKRFWIFYLHFLLGVLLSVRCLSGWNLPNAQIIIHFILGTAFWLFHFVFLFIFLIRIMFRLLTDHDKIIGFCELSIELWKTFKVFVLKGRIYIWKTLLHLLFARIEIRKALAIGTNARETHQILFGKIRLFYVFVSVVTDALIKIFVKVDCAIHIDF